MENEINEKPQGWEKAKRHLIKSLKGGEGTTEEVADFRDYLKWAAGKFITRRGQIRTSWEDEAHTFYVLQFPGWVANPMHQSLLSLPEVAWERFHKFVTEWMFKRRDELAQQISTEKRITPTIDRKLAGDDDYMKDGKEVLEGELNRPEGEEKGEALDLSETDDEEKAEEDALDGTFTRVEPDDAQVAKKREKQDLMRATLKGCAPAAVEWLIREPGNKNIVVFFQVMLETLRHGVKNYLSAEDIFEQLVERMAGVELDFPTEDDLTNALARAFWAEVQKSGGAQHGPCFAYGPCGMSETPTLEPARRKRKSISQKDQRQLFELSPSQMEYQVAQERQWQAEDKSAEESNKKIEELLKKYLPLIDKILANIEKT
jgi:hypothetical protein